MRVKTDLPRHLEFYHKSNTLLSRFADRLFRVTLNFFFVTLGFLFLTFLLFGFLFLTFLRFLFTLLLTRNRFLTTLLLLFRPNFLVLVLPRVLFSRYKRGNLRRLRGLFNLYKIRPLF